MRRWQQRGSSLKRWLQTHPYLIASLTITILVLSLRQLGGLQALELDAFDVLVRLQPDQGEAPELLLVGIEEEDIQQQNEWPLSDQTVATLLGILQTYQPQAIGLDLYRDIPYPPGNAELSAQLQAPNVFAIAALGIDADNSVPSPRRMPPDRVGFNDFVIDSDGILRRNLMFAALGDTRLYSFALRLSLYALGLDANAVIVNEDGLQIGNYQWQPLNNDSGGYQIVDAAGYQFMLRYRSPVHPAHFISLSQILAGKFEAKDIRDKIVLIGTVAPSEKDFFYTPYSAGKADNHVMPGVVIHAQMVSQIIDTVTGKRASVWYWSQRQEYLWIFCWALLGGVLAWRLKHPLSIGLASIVALLCLFAGCFSVFAYAGWIPLIPPALTFTLTAGSVMVYTVFYRSFYDPLTGLPNRQSFLKKLRKRLGHNGCRDRELAVLFVDIDDFKVINESFGHQFGDQFLKTIARQIEACLPTAIVARVGADEFALLITQTRSHPALNQVSGELPGELVRVSDCAIATADRLQKLLNAPLHIQQQALVPTASVGIALSQTSYSHQAEDLLQDAHRATYRAKSLGRDRYEVFAKGMRIQAVSRFQLEMELRHAIAAESFQVYYQPIIDLSQGKIVGFESLVRWIHPERGFVSPAEFIPVAEETGMILPLGQWILRVACQQMYHWHQQFAQDPPLFISVNLSAKQFIQSSLTDEIKQILQTTQLNCNSLKLELTESIAMENIENAINQLLRLKEMGLKLSIDDFGTGYSSLSSLHRFPTDTLKVDQSFVGRMDQTSNDNDIVSTIITLGHKLGMDIVAEGIETAAQLSGLRRLKCDYGQGYFFSKPLPVEKAESLLREDPRW